MRKIGAFIILLITIVLNHAAFAEQSLLSPDLQKKLQVLTQKAPNIDKKVLRLGLIAWSKAEKKGLNEKPILTVIDYSKPSYEKKIVGV